MQSIKSIGFESLEREILAKQVRTISTRLHKEWNYVGEGKDADIVLVKKPVDLPAGSVQVMVGKDCTDHTAPFLESPVRMMQLASLLESFTKSKESVIEAINKLFQQAKPGTFIINCKIGAVGFNTKEKKISTKQRSLSTLIKNLSATPTQQLLLENAKPEPDNFTWEFTAPYRTVIWHLAKFEGQSSTSNFNANASYKLSSWPRVTEWDPNPHNFKLATLFSRQYLSIAQAAKVCKVTEEDVKLFLHCSKSCGIRLLQQASTATKSNKQRHVVKDEQSLGWLRRKIKTVFNYGH